MYRIARFLKIIPIIIVASIVFGFVTRELWNWLMPSIFGLHTITYWQAIGLFLLSKLIFGGFHGHHRGGGRDRWEHRMKERWVSMTPEEREKFRNGMKCGPFVRGRSEASPIGRPPFNQPEEPTI